MTVSWSNPRMDPNGARSLPDPAVERLGQGLLRVRLQCGLSQRQLEARSGVDQTVICRLETGKRTTRSVRQVARLLDALDADPARGLPRSADWS